MEWASKKLVAAAVNRCLGWLLEDVTDSLVGDALRQGDLDLHDVRIRRDALSFLDAHYGSSLPIEVVRGTVGRLHITVPYSNILTQPLLIEIEDVLLLAGPAQHRNDPDRQREAERASKRSQLAALFPEPTQQADTSYIYDRFFNNLELHINGVHIRYEDTTIASKPMAMGFCLKSMSVYTTNGKWKKTSAESSSSTVHKIVDFAGVSAYVNPNSDPQRMVKPHASSDLWIEYMKLGLNSYTINSEPFSFMVRPLRCKVKLRQQQAVEGEARGPALLVDAVVKEEAAVVVSSAQLTALVDLMHGFEMVHRNKRFWKYRPLVPLKRHAVDWWHYAFESFVQARIKPRRWESIKAHRDRYKAYIGLYMRKLTEPRNSELEVDLLRHEDGLDLLNITLARCEAKHKVMRALQVAQKENTTKPRNKDRSGWFSWFWNTSEADEVDLALPSARGGELACLTKEERKLLKIDEVDLVASSAPAATDKENIDQKIYVTLQSASISLRDQEHEVAVASLTGLGANYEARWGVGYQKYSLKLDSLAVEGCNHENDLVSVFKLVEDPSFRGNSFGFSCDYEVNPLSSKADFGLTMRLHPLEVTYNQKAFSEIWDFFQIPGIQQTSIDELTLRAANEVMETTKTGMTFVLLRQKTISLDVDIRSPYIILPEHGSLQSGGNVLIIDVGGLKILSEAGGKAKELEHATKMEVHELIYDRLTVSIAQFQVLFSDSGDEWRAMRSSDDSALHLLPRVQIKIDLANHVYPKSFPRHPKQKLDFHITPLKLNMSENRLTLLIDFFQNFPLPLKTNGSDGVDSFQIIDEVVDTTDCIIDSRIDSLFALKHFLNSPIGDSVDNAITTPPLLQMLKEKKSVDDMSQTSLELQMYFPNSDTSDDDVDTHPESLKAVADLPGFDENVSPDNKMTVLTRFCVEEITLCISHSDDKRDYPYLMLRLSHLVMEVAMMDHGPAVQLTLQSLHLVDKCHQCLEGEYLELVSSPPKTSVLSLKYRKVDAKCKDFDTYFQSTEQSLIVNVASLHFVCHRASILTLSSFLNRIWSKLSVPTPKIPEVRIDESFINIMTTPENSPVPSGAVKWSVAIHCNAIRLNLCDSDIEVMTVIFSRLESKCLFKANSKKTFQCCLGDIVVEDHSENSLYSTLVELEEDFVLDIKYDQLTSSMDKEFSETSKQDGSTKPEANLDIRFGRLQIVFLWKIFSDLHRFIELIPTRDNMQPIPKLPGSGEETSLVKTLLQMRVMYRVDIQAPTVIIPQKADSPSSLVFNLGSIKVENMFTASGIENVLVEVGPFHVCRAVMALTGGLEMQEAIVDPTTLRCDVKRSRMPAQSSEHALCNVDVQLGTMRVNLGQRDLSAILALWSDFKTEGFLANNSVTSMPSTPITSFSPEDADENVGKLQAFLTSAGIYKMATVGICVDNLTVTLYTDLDEPLSSPVRDAAKALARMDIGEVELKAHVNSDQSVAARFTVASCNIFDVRPDSKNVVKKLFGQYSKDDTIKCGVRVSSPQLLDVTYNITAEHDSNLEITLEKTRFNVSVNFCLALFNYVANAHPTEGIKHPLTNPEFTDVVTEDAFAENQALSSIDSTSGYLSSLTCASENSSGLTVSLHVNPPEIIIFTDPEQHGSPIFIFSFETSIDLSYNEVYEDCKVQIEGINLMAANYYENNQVPYAVLERFDISLTTKKSFKDDENKTEVKTTCIDAHLCPAVVALAMKLYSEGEEFFSSQLCNTNLRLPSAELENLWSPRKLTSDYYHSSLQNEIAQLVKKRRPKGLKQLLIVQTGDIEISLEDQNPSLVPILLLKGNLSSEIRFCNNCVMESSHEIKLTANYFNKDFSKWEPILEPITAQNQSSDLFVLTVRSSIVPAKPVGVRSLEAKDDVDAVDGCPSLAGGAGSDCTRSDRTRTIATNCSESSSSDPDSDSEMVIMRAPPQHKTSRTTFTTQTISQSASGGDCDSDTEDDIVDSLCHAFNHYFSSDSEDEDDDSSADPDTDADLLDDAPEVTDGVDHTQGRPEDGESEGATSPDPPSVEDEDAPLVLVGSPDPLELTFTPRMLRDSVQLLGHYAQKTSPDTLPQPLGDLTGPLDYHLTNEIGPGAVVTLLDNGQELLRAEYGRSSTESSPAHSNCSPALSDEDSPATCVDWDEITLQLSPPPPSLLRRLPEPGSPDALHHTALSSDITRRKIRITKPGFQPLEVFVGIRPRCRAFPLQPHTPGDLCYVLVQVTVADQLQVSVSSPLQVRNDTCLPLNVCFKKSSLPDSAAGSVTSISSNPFDAFPALATLQPDQCMTVPLEAAHYSALHIQPAASEYGVSAEGAWWKDFSFDRPLYLSCRHKDGTPLTVAVSVKAGPPPSNTPPATEPQPAMPHYLLSLQAPTVVHNLLPHTLLVGHHSFPQPLSLDPGLSKPFYRLDLSQTLDFKLKVCNYQGSDWRGQLSVPVASSGGERGVELAKEEGGGRLEVAVREVRSPATALYIFAPHWIVNKTGLPLRVRGSGSKVEFESNSQEDIILFKYRRKNKKKIKARVAETDWSQAWSLEAAGTGGIVVCKDKNRKKNYRICCSITNVALQATIPTATGPMVKGAITAPLSTLVTLTPRFVVRNHTARPLRFLEENDTMDLWNDLEPNEVKGFWPERSTMMMMVQQRDTKTRSRHFSFDEPHTTVLRMEQGRALVVRVAATTSDLEPVLITFEPYCSGAAPVRIENWCDDVVLRLHQEKSREVTLLQQHHSLLYTWDDPCLPHTLLWSVYDKRKQEFSADICRDGVGTEVIHAEFSSTLQPQLTTSEKAKQRPDKGRQRTEKSKKRSEKNRPVRANSSSDEEEDADERDSGRRSLQDSTEKGRAGLAKEKRTKLSLYWVSFREGDQRVLLFTQSKLLRDRLGDQPEHASFQLALMLPRIGVSLVSQGSELCYLSVQSCPSRWTAEHRGKLKEIPTLEMEAWLEDQYQNNANSDVVMQGSLEKSVSGSRKISVNFKNMEMSQPLVAKLLRNQIAAVELKLRWSQHLRSLALQLGHLQVDNQLSSAHFPCVLSPTTPFRQPCAKVSIVVHQDDTSTTVRDVNLFIGDVALRIDQEFLNKMQSFFLAIYPQSLPTCEGLRTQLQEMATPLAIRYRQPTTVTTHHYGMVERLTISQTSITLDYHPSSDHTAVDGLASFLQYFANPLAEITGASFSLPPYQRHHQPLHGLLASITHHYKTYINKKCCMLFFNLDILGNPSKRVRDLQEGFTDAINETAKESADRHTTDLTVICRTLFSLTVGSAVDVAVDMTSVLGNMMANLTFDRHYIKNRQDILERKKPGTLPNFLQANRFFALGVLDGLTATITSPIAGARQSGIVGFFRGIGFGILKLVTMPVIGIRDAVSFTLDSVKRAIAGGVKLSMRERLPRHVSPFSALVAYDKREAEGRALLAALRHGRYARTDHYHAHALLVQGKKPSVALLTNRSVYLIERFTVLNEGELRWMVSLSNITSMVLHEPQGGGEASTLLLQLKDRSGQGAEPVRRLESNDTAALEYLKRGIETLQYWSMEDSAVPGTKTGV